MKTWIHRSVALIAGAALASLVASLFGGGDLGIVALWMPLLVGNLMISCGLGLVLIVVSLIPGLGSRLPAPIGWMLASFLLGLVPVLGGLGLAASLFLPLGAVAVVLGLSLGSRLPSCSLRAQSISATLLCVLAVFSGYWNHKTLRDANRVKSSPVLPAPSVDVDLEGPDIILISLDTFRSDILLDDREPAYELPFFDQFRADGNWWDYSYSSSNQTLPGHASMLSGHDALASGVRYNFNNLPSSTELPMVSQYLQEAGYQTAGVISNALIAGDMGFSVGFDLYDDSTTPQFGPRTACLNHLKTDSWLGALVPQEAILFLLAHSSYSALNRPPRGLDGHGLEERGRVTTNQGMEVLEQLYQHDRPFFFFLHYLDVHHPYGAPAPFRGTLTAGLPELPERYQGPDTHNGMILLEQLHTMRDDLKSEDPVVHAEAQAGAEYYRRMYLENALYLDGLLAEVRKRVEDSGRPALWIITGDHGEQFGENDSLIHGNHLYQDSIRVPFLMMGPGVAKNVHRGGIPDVADVAPTILEFAGLEIPQTMTGRPVFGDGPLEEKVHVVHDDMRVMIRVGPQKMIVKRSADGFTPTAVYDLSVDPEEANNLLDKADFQNRLIGILEEELLRDRFNQDGVVLSAEQLAALSDLGYVDGSADDEHQH